MNQSPTASAEMPRGHPLKHPKAWKDPSSGLTVPKEMLANLEYREHLLKECEEDEQLRAAVLYNCRKSFLYWLNTFGVTFKLIEVVDGQQRPVAGTGTKLIPFISWPCQDVAAAQILRCVREGRDLVIDKSRDMGASWLCLMVFIWLWLFVPQSVLMIVSRKEDLVDASGDPDTLFWKIDRVLEKLPWWMVPAKDRTHMHLANLANGSVIDGEATTGNIGRGGRRMAILFDEAAAIPMLQDAIMASADTTPCRIFNSTPAGPGAYSDLRFSGLDVVILGYWDHPEKGKGRELRFDPRVGRVVWWTPWYEYQWTVRKRSRKDMAQNVLIDHMTSGSMVFSSDVLSRHLSTYITPPTWRGDIDVDVRSVGDKDTAIAQRRADFLGLREEVDGDLRLWCGLLVDRRSGLLRPRQDRTYCMGIDVSLGSGHSNSVIAIGEAETGRKIGMFVSANISPEDLARKAAMIGCWLGGHRGLAFMTWDAIGVGGTFTRKIRSLGYPWLDRHVPDGKATRKATQTLGSASCGSHAALIVLMGELDGDMSSDRYIEVDEETIKEEGRWVYYEGKKGIGPARLEHESADAIATHGDRVIGTALLNRAMKRCGRVKPAETPPPFGSLAWREKRERDEAGDDEEAEE